MNYNSWNILLDLINNETLDFKEEGAFINGEVSDFRKIRSLVRKAMHDFFEECRINYIEEENKQLVWRTFQDFIIKLEFLVNDFFSIKHDGDDEIITYIPMKVVINREPSQTLEKSLFYIFQTINHTRDFLLRREGDFMFEGPNVENHAQKKGTYNSSYNSGGYLLHSGLKITTPEDRNIRLQDTYHELTNSKLIEDGYLREVLSLFNGSISSRKIRWTGSKNELKYFISQLLELQIIEDPKRRLYNIAEEAFTFSDGEPIITGTLSARKSPDNTRSIDFIIQKLMGK